MGHMQALKDPSGIQYLPCKDRVWTELLDSIPLHLWMSMCVSIFKVYSLLQLHHLLYFIYSTVIKVTMACKFLIYILIYFLKIMKCIKVSLV